MYWINASCLHGIDNDGQYLLPRGLFKAIHMLIDVRHRFNDYRNRCQNRARNVRRMDDAEYCYPLLPSFWFETLVGLGLFCIAS